MSRSCRGAYNGGGEGCEELAPDSGEVAGVVEREDGDRITVAPVDRNEKAPASEK